MGNPKILPGKRAVSPPLGLATLAALCPSGWRIEIVDENIEPIPLTPGPTSLASAEWACSSPARRNC